MAPAHRHSLAVIGFGLALLLSQAPLLLAFDMTSDEPSFAQAERRILTTFSTVGPIPEGSVLTEDRFDFQAYATHECFEPKGEGEWQECRDMFGPYANLRQTLDSGRLREILRHPVVQGGGFTASAKTYDVRGELQENERVARERAEENATQLRYRQTADRRARLLWSLCRERLQPQFAGTCYQQNLRLMMMHELDLASNLHIYFQ